MPNPTKQQRLELEELENRRRQILELNNQSRGLNTRTMQTHLFTLQAFLKKAADAIGDDEGEKMTALKAELNKTAESFEKLRSSTILEKNNYDFVQAIRSVTGLSDLLLQRDDQGRLYFDIVEEKGRDYDGAGNYDRGNIFRAVDAVNGVLDCGLEQLPEDIAAEQGEEKRELYRNGQALRDFIQDPTTQYVGTLMTNSPQYGKLQSFLINIDTVSGRNVPDAAKKLYTRAKTQAQLLKYAVDKARETTSPGERRRMIIDAARALKALEGVRKDMNESGIEGINDDLVDFGVDIPSTDYADGQDVIARFFPADDPKVVAQYNYRAVSPELSIDLPPGITEGMVMSTMLFAAHEAAGNVNPNGEAAQPWHRLVEFENNLSDTIDALPENDPKRLALTPVRDAFRAWGRQIDTTREQGVGGGYMRFLKCADEYNKAQEALKTFNETYPQYKEDLIRAGANFFSQWALQDYVSHRRNAYANLTDENLSFDSSQPVPDPRPVFEQETADDLVKSYDQEQADYFIPEDIAEKASSLANIGITNHFIANDGAAIKALAGGPQAKFQAWDDQFRAIIEKGNGLYKYQNDTQQLARKLAAEFRVLPGRVKDLEGRSDETKSKGDIVSSIRSIITTCKEAADRPVVGEPAEGQTGGFYYPAPFRKLCRQTAAKLERYLDKHFVIDAEHPFEDFVIKNSGKNAAGKGVEALTNVMAAYQWKIRNEKLPEDQRTPFDKKQIQKNAKEIQQNPIFREFFKNTRGKAEAGYDGLSGSSIRAYSEEHRYLQVLKHMDNPFAYRTTPEQQRSALRELQELDRLLDSCEGASADYKDFFHALKDLKNKNIRTMSSEEMAKTLKDIYGKTEKVMKGRKRSRRTAEQRERFEQTLDVLSILSKTGRYGKALADKLVNRTNVVRGHWLQKKVSLKDRSTEKTRNRLAKLRGVQKTLKANDEIRAKEREIAKKNYIKASDVKSAEELPELPDSVGETVSVDDKKAELIGNMNAENATYNQVGSAVPQMLAFSSTPAFKDKNGNAVMPAGDYKKVVNAMASHEATSKIVGEMTNPGRRKQLMSKDDPFGALRTEFDAKNAEMQAAQEDEEREVLGSAYGMSDEECREVLRKRREMQKAAEDEDYFAAMGHEAPAKEEEEKEKGDGDGEEKEEELNRSYSSVSSM